MATLLYIGNFAHERSTENAYRYAFTRHGCNVITMQQDIARPISDGLLDTLDAVIYTRTHNRTALGPDWTDQWRRYEGRGIKTVSIHLDVFVGVERYGMPDPWWTDPLFTTGTVFTPDPMLAEFVTSERTEHCWLPPAADVRDSDPEGEPIAGLSGKVVFVGTRYGTPGRHPEYPFRATLLDWLAKTYRYEFFWYGSGAPFGAIRGRSVWDVYASDCAVVGDSCFAGSRPRYWSDRVPETLAHGGLLVHPYVDGLADWHRIPMYEAGNFDALAKLIDGARTLPATTRRELHARYRDQTRKAHTYVHRASTILGQLGLG